MTPMDRIPLLDLSRNIDPATITSIQNALLRYGVFRLWAPDLKSAHTLELQKNVSTSLFSNLTFRQTESIQAREFFQLPLDVKAKTTGYTAFESELIRGDTPIPKESIYFFRGGDIQQNPPPRALRDSINVLHDVRFMGFSFRDIPHTKILAKEMETVERHHLLDHV